MNKKVFDAIVEQLGRLLAKDDFVLVIRDRRTGMMSSAHSIAAREKSDILAKVIAVIKNEGVSRSSASHDKSFA